MFQLLILIVSLLIPSITFAQAPIQQVHPGCTFTWEEPMVPNTNTSEPDDMIGAWELAGDLAGFQWVTNTELVFDPLKMILIDRDKRQVLCSTVGVEEVQDYFVMLKAYDTSGNASDFIALNFSVVIEDITAPLPATKICLQGTLRGQPAEFCGFFDAQ